MHHERFIGQPLSWLSTQSLVKEGLFSTVKTTTSGPALQSLFHVLVDRHGVPVTGL
jgi:hypothetical protein